MKSIKLVVAAAAVLAASSAFADNGVPDNDWLMKPQLLTTQQVATPQDPATPPSPAAADPKTDKSFISVTRQQSDFVIP